MGLLTPESLADRLTKRLPMLTGGLRDAPERQRTLSATIGWSHDLLDAEAQRLFARLSVFSGGWTLERSRARVRRGSRRARCDGQAGGRELGSAIRPGYGRGALLDARDDPRVRGHASSTCRANASAIATRHAEWVGSLTAEAEPHMADEEQSSWFVVLEREHDNIRAALDLAEENGQDRRAVETGLRTAAAIWRFWQERNHLAEAAGPARTAALPARGTPSGRGPSPRARRLWRDPLLAVGLRGHAGGLRGSRDDRALPGRPSTPGERAVRPVVRARHGRRRLRGGGTDHA